MYSWVKLSHLAEWTKAKPIDRSADFSVETISTDTRNIKKGDVFLALKGESFDGNEYLSQAAAAGASAVISDRDAKLSIPVLKVDDTLKALIAIGEALRDKFTGKVVAVTGSAGKSSTKEMIATLLGDKTVASPASFNNLMGVSRTLCLVEDSTKNLVLEMGMNNFGEIAELCRHFKPHAGLITNIGDAHIGKLGGQRGIYKAKKELFDYLASSQTLGYALNVDDLLVEEAGREAFKGKQPKVVTYSASSSKAKTADVRVLSQRMDPKTGFLELKLEVSKKSFDTKIPIFGLHQAQNIAAALAMVTLMGEALDAVIARLPNIHPAYHRGEVLNFGDGNILVDESYNSNPAALTSSLTSLQDFDPARRRVLVLGEMREMGEFGAQVHQQVGAALVELHKRRPSPLVVIGVGPLMKHFLAEVENGIPAAETRHVSDHGAALSEVRKVLKAGDLVLVKGSRGVVLDKLVTALIASDGAGR